MEMVCLSVHFLVVWSLTWQEEAFGGWLKERERKRERERCDVTGLLFEPLKVIPVLAQTRAKLTEQSPLRAFTDARLEPLHTLHSPFTTHSVQSSVKREVLSEMFPLGDEQATSGGRPVTSPLGVRLKEWYTLLQSRLKSKFRDWRRENTNLRRVKVMTLFVCFEHVLRLCSGNNHGLC